MQPDKTATVDSTEAGTLAEQANTPDAPARDCAEHASAREGGSPSAEAAATADGKQLVLQRILTAHETWFDVTRGYEYAGRTFDGYAEFHSHGEGYVLVKRAKMWEVDNHEYLFFLVREHLDEAGLAELIGFMKTDALRKVDPEPNHMSSCISLVVIADDVSEAAMKLARRTRFRKNFAFGIRGWADMRIAVVDVSTQTVQTNAAGKTMKATLEANVALPAASQGK